MMLKKVAIVVGSLMLMSGIAYADTIKLGGGAPPIEKAIDPIRNAFAQSSGHEISATKYGPKFALQDLEAGKIDAAVLFTTIEEIKSLAKKENLTINADQYQGTTVAKDTIILMVNKENPVTGLSKEQAKGIYTGTIDNWKTVGGKDQPVIVVWSDIVKGLNEIFGRKVLEGAAPMKEVLTVGSAADMRNAVATNPEAVALTSAGSVSANVKSLSEPRVDVPLIIYTKGAPSAKVKQLIDYLAAHKK